MAKKVYLICPVRNTDLDFSAFVQEWEKLGYQIHFPPRDVDQTQESLPICKTHAKAMKKCDEVWIFWDDESKGSHFDLGMAFVLGKPLRLIKVLREAESRKNYLKVIRDVIEENELSRRHVSEDDADSNWIELGTCP